MLHFLKDIILRYILRKVVNIDLVVFERCYSMEACWYTWTTSSKISRFHPTCRFHNSADQCGKNKYFHEIPSKHHRQYFQIFFSNIYIRISTSRTSCWSWKKRFHDCNFDDWRYINFMEQPSYSIIEILKQFLSCSACCHCKTVEIVGENTEFWVIPCVDIMSYSKRSRLHSSTQYFWHALWTPTIFIPVRAPATLLVHVSVVVVLQVDPAG